MVVALIALVNGVILGATRVLYAMSCDGWGVRAFTRVNQGRHAFRGTFVEHRSYDGVSAFRIVQPRDCRHHILLRREVRHLVFRRVCAPQARAGIRRGPIERGAIRGRPPWLLRDRWPFSRVRSQATCETASTVCASARQLSGVSLDQKERAAGSFGSIVQFAGADQRRSLNISRAAFAPEIPVIPFPGWVPDPQRYSPFTGVR